MQQGTTKVPHPGSSLSRIRTPRMQAVHLCVLLFTIALSFCAITAVTSVVNENKQSEQAQQRYENCENAAHQFMDASDYLTNQARLYVLTGDTQYLDNYIKEIDENGTRNEALTTLTANSESGRAIEELKNALELSQELSEKELYSLRLSAESRGVDAKAMPARLADVRLETEHARMTSKEKQRHAEELTISTDYQDTKASIKQRVDGCIQSLNDELHARQREGNHRLDSLLFTLTIAVVLMVLLVVAMVLINYLLMVRPMLAHTKSIAENRKLVPAGAQELRQLALSYNLIYQENSARASELQREAETDSLTGLLNRGAYDRILGEVADNVVLILADVDMFKQINDTYGHEVGDSVLRKVGSAIKGQFRTSDYACRIGGDEFAIVMTDTEGANRETISTKLRHIASALADTSDGLPTATLSMGVAMCTEPTQKETLYRAADESLYEAKRLGRDRFAFHEA